MTFELKIPEIGESIIEGLLVEWSKNDGDMVAVDEQVLVLETDKITMTITSERAGRITTIIPAGQTVEVGQVVATIDESARPEAGAPTKSVEDEPAAAAAEQEEKPDLSALSPAVRKMIIELHLDPAGIVGTGKEGRILKSDVLRHIEQLFDVVVALVGLA